MYNVKKKRISIKPQKLIKIKITCEIFTDAVQRLYPQGGALVLMNLIQPRGRSVVN